MSVDDGPSVPAASPGEGETRRTVLGSACGAAMVGTLVASYGTLFSYAGRFLYPAKPAPKAWMFVIDAVRMKPGDSLLFTTPGGARVAIARQGEKGDVSDFIALSSVCPHLGCQVHWEGQNNRFFCPCHNGVFDPAGKATSGPPADAGQSLPTFPLKLENGLLFIEVQTQSLTAGHCDDDLADEAPPGRARAFAATDGQHSVLVETGRALPGGACDVTQPEGGVA